MYFSCNEYAKRRAKRYLFLITNLFYFLYVSYGKPSYCYYILSRTSFNFSVFCNFEMKSYTVIKFNLAFFKGRIGQRNVNFYSGPFVLLFNVGIIFFVKIEHACVTHL